MKTNAMPEEWGPPAKNWLKQRAGLLLNDAAIQLVWAEVVRQRPDPKPKKAGMPISRSTGSSHTKTTRSGFSAQALRLADVSLDPYDPPNVEKNKRIGMAFRDERQNLLFSLNSLTSNVWGDRAPEYLHWLRLEFLLDMTPDKRRGLPTSEWLPSWPVSLRSEILSEYTRLETLLRRYDDPYTRNEETKAWKQRERWLFQTLWDSDSRTTWNHPTFTATLALMSLQKKGVLKYWCPWEFAGTLQRQASPKLSTAEQAQLDAWMEGCATGKFDPNNPDALAMFLSTAR